MHLSNHQTRRYQRLAALVILALCGITIYYLIRPAPMIRAAMNGDVAAIEVLVEDGANINIQRSGLLRSLYYNWTPLMWAAYRSDRRVMQVLLDNGADPDIVAKNGETALLLSFQKNCIECIELLLENGADVNQKWPSGETPLFRAVRENRIDLVRMLINSDANVVRRGLGNMTPAEYAVLHNADQEIINLVSRE